MHIGSRPAISDIAIIEGWPLGEVMQLFPDSPDIHRDWSGKIQLFSLFDLSGKHSVGIRDRTYAVLSATLIMP
jgi:hypothetical protein